VNLQDEEKPVETNIEQEMDKPWRTMTTNGAQQWRRGALQGEKRDVQRAERSGGGLGGCGVPGRPGGFRAAAGAQGDDGGVCECVSVRQGWVI